MSVKNLEEKEKQDKKNNKKENKMERINIIVTNEKLGLSKIIDATNFTVGEFEKTCKAYAVNYDVRIKRYI